jgi:deoxycytidylate deaminase
MGVGYNGFPRGVRDTEDRYADRPEKYATVVHAELNAILNSQHTEGMTMYVWPMMPCPDCAKAIIQAGIVRVIAPVMPISQRTRWQSKMEFSVRMMREAGIIIRYWEDPDVSREDKNEKLIEQALDELHAANEAEMQRERARGETVELPEQGENTTN